MVVALGLMGHRWAICILQAVEFRSSDHCKEVGVPASEPRRMECCVRDRCSAIPCLAFGMGVPAVYVAGLARVYQFVVSNAA